MNTLLELRKAKGLSQARLAVLANTTPGQIKHLEKGVRKLTKEWAERIAPHLGVTAQELLFPDDSVEYSTKMVTRKNTSGVPILLQLSNKEWIENLGDIEELANSNLNSFDLKSDKKLFAVRLLLDLQNGLARLNELAICVPIAQGDISELANNDIILIKTALPNTNLAKYSLYWLYLKAGSTEIELQNCFINAEEDKIKLDVTDMQNITIKAKVCYFVRLPQ
ncbi:MAG: helix-turn-helix transcriptional regulator [Alphaproteobacteria bacterium]|nr:helix-turn-helix transcriptional regulator [Alphaproteobacteria bacterium]